jgi:hypothetical protein
MNDSSSDSPTPLKFIPVTGSFSKRAIAISLLTSKGSDWLTHTSVGPRPSESRLIIASIFES